MLLIQTLQQTLQTYQLLFLYQCKLLFSFKIGRSYIQLKVYCSLVQWFHWSVIQKRQDHVLRDFQSLNDQQLNRKTSNQG